MSRHGLHFLCPVLLPTFSTFNLIFYCLTRFCYVNIWYNTQTNGSQWVLCLPHYKNIPACSTVVSWHLDFPLSLSDGIKLTMTWKCLSQHDSLTWHREHGVGAGERGVGTNNILCICAHTQKDVRAHLHRFTPRSFPRSITASWVHTPSLSANEWTKVRLKSSESTAQPDIF